jgi:hypothetical protein
LTNVTGTSTIKSTNKHKYKQTLNQITIQNHKQSLLDHHNLNLSGQTSMLNYNHPHQTSAAFKLTLMASADIMNSINMDKLLAFSGLHTTLTNSRCSNPSANTDDIAPAAASQQNQMSGLQAHNKSQAKAHPPQLHSLRTSRKLNTPQAAHLTLLVVKCLPCNLHTLLLVIIFEVCLNFCGVTKMLSSATSSIFNSC